MSGRFRIDWQNLRQLPRRKADGATKEDLAARKFNIAKAKHRGRNHLSNQKRRQAKKDADAKAAKRNAIKNDKYRAHKSMVAKFWAGEIDCHP